MGTGTLAAYARNNDSYRFYEINAAVVELSDRYFTFRSDAVARGADVDTLLGDARIVMEQQLAEDESQAFDVLALDAFTSDAIPVHLLTREAFAIYWRHLHSDGILAVHVSNRYLDLTAVVRKLAELNGKDAVWIEGAADEEQGVTPSRWVLVTSNRAFLESDVVRRASTPWPADARAPLLWTDDYSNLFQLLR